MVGSERETKLQVMRKGQRVHFSKGGPFGGRAGSLHG